MSEGMKSDGRPEGDAAGEFARPLPVGLAGPRPDRFKRPVLVGPRRGGRKPTVVSDSSLGKIMELNAKLQSGGDPAERPPAELPPPEPPAPREQLAPFPLVISDFSDKVLPPEFPYTEPPWKGLPDSKYFLEELKSGVIEKEVGLSGRSVTVVGRLDCCHVEMAHPTVSRFHAVLQFRAARQGIYDRGFYLYDLGSTHGSFLNKNRLKPRTYVRVQVGHVMKFGCSTRLFILQGPTEDQEPESEHTVTELQEMRRRELEERQAEQQRRLESEQQLRSASEASGVDWGIGEDAEEETDLSENPFAVTTNEEAYAEDPKRELKKWFEREGEEFSMDIEQAERGKMVCRITLPLEDGKGGEVVIESNGRSKKEATSTCALEACRYIDRMGLFNKSHQESRKREQRNWEENDYYDSDEDSFFDRTGDVDDKRNKRMRKAGKLQESVQTYESLVESHKELLKKLSEVEKKYREMTAAALAGARGTGDGESDELDQYMRSLGSSVPGKLDLRICQSEMNNLREEEGRLIKLINLAKPASLPELKPYVHKVGSPEVVPRVVDREEPLPKPLSSQRSGVSLPNPTNVIGPARPTEASVSEPPKKQKRSRNRQRDRPHKSGDPHQFDSGEFSDLTWQPPVGQTGDGRTALNDKYGY